MRSNLPNHHFISYNLRDKHHGNENENFKSRNCGPIRSTLAFPSTREEYLERRHQVSMGPPKGQEEPQQLTQSFPRSFHWALKIFLLYSLPTGS